MKRCCVRLFGSLMGSPHFVAPRGTAPLLEPVAFFNECARLPKTDELFMTPYVESPIKDRILSIVLRKAQTLYSEGYVQCVGAQSNVLVGERGVGKSNTLKRAALLVGQRHPDVLSMYAAYSSFLGPPSAMIRDALATRAVAVPAAATLEDMLQLLERHNLFAVLIGDEFDQLYKRAESDREALAVVREFSALGCSARGRVSPILCGSSGNLPLLVSGKGATDEFLGRKFPLSKVTPDMNGSKFESIHCGNSRFSAIISNRILDFYFPVDTLSPGNSEKARRLVYFFCDSNFRRIEKLSKGELTTTCRYQWGIRSSSVPLDDHQRLITAMDTGLYEANQELLKPIEQAQSLNELVAAIAAVDWVTQVTGLSRDALAKIRTTHRAELSVIQDLVDKGWYNASPQLATVYPGTAAFLLTGATNFNATPLAKWKKSLSKPELLDQVNAHLLDLGVDVLKVGVTSLLALALGVSL